MTNKMKNPIIPGYYPDPSICRVGDDYYLACSSFEMYPGIPIFHSKDLVHWEQICNAMTMENGFHVEKNCGSGGVMAPTLRYHVQKKLFYLINANFSDKGNYIVTAEDPAGPWSAPHWLDDVPGIDASLFFDDDGQAYIMGTGDVWDNGTGQKERGIWLAKYDIDNFRLDGEPFAIFNNALRVATSPEAPHIYHIGEYYYLIIAEGGTEHYHSVAVARSKELFSHFEGNPANPVMTHRHMGFTSPIINVGHADLVELPDGSWYAVMLASRLIDGKGKNIGRETFICPVVWERGWPLFSPETGKVEWEYDAPACLPWTEFPAKTALDGFDSEELALDWVFWGTPYRKFYRIQNSKLSLQCIRQALAEDILPMGMEGNGSKEHFVSMLAKRQCEPHTMVTCQMSFWPEGKESAGLAIVQAMNHQVHIERVAVDGKQMLRSKVFTSDFDVPPYLPGFKEVTSGNITAEVGWEENDIVLQVEMRQEQFIIRYGSLRESLKELCTVDGNLINPEKVGCMTGTLVGMFASGNGTESENAAEFDWFEMTDL